MDFFSPQWQCQELCRVLSFALFVSWHHPGVMVKAPLQMLACTVGWTAGEEYWVWGTILLLEQEVNKPEVCVLWKMLSHLSRYYGPGKKRLGPCTLSTQQGYAGMLRAHAGLFLFTASSSNYIWMYINSILYRLKVTFHLTLRWGFFVCLFVLYKDLEISNLWVWYFSNTHSWYECVCCSNFALHCDVHVLLPSSQIMLSHCYIVM